MRRQILVVLAFAAVAVVTNVGFKLLGAVRQIDTLAAASVGSTDSTGSAALRVEPAPLVSPAPETKVTERTAPTLELPVPASEPEVRFDAEAASREAGDRDANVAEFLNDPDPAVGGAVRDFITSLAPPGRN